MKLCVFTTSGAVAVLDGPAQKTVAVANVRDPSFETRFLVVEGTHAYLGLISRAVAIDLAALRLSADVSSDSAFVCGALFGGEVVVGGMGGVRKIDATLKERSGWRVAAPTAFSVFGDRLFAAANDGRVVACQGSDTKDATLTPRDRSASVTAIEASRAPLVYTGTMRGRVAIYSGSRDASEPKEIATGESRILALAPAADDSVLVVSADGFVRQVWKDGRVEKREHWAVGFSAAIAEGGGFLLGDPEGGVLTYSAKDGYTKIAEATPDLGGIAALARIGATP